MMRITAGIGGLLAWLLLTPAMAQETPPAGAGDQPEPSEMILEQEAPVTKGAVLDIDEETARKVQEQLNSHGYEVEVSGKWDESTQEALTKFQQEQNLPATGSLDTRTLAALGVEIEGEAASFAELDKNQDGMISQEEASGSPLEDSFQQADTDGDNNLTEAEFSAFQEKQGEQPAAEGAEQPAGTEQPAGESQQ